MNAPGFGKFRIALSPEYHRTYWVFKLCQPKTDRAFPCSRWLR